MKFSEEVKNMLRPYYHKLKRMAGFKTAYESEKEAIKYSYKIFQGVSSKSNIRNIVFENNDCIYTLEDDRRYYFDPFDNVASMYSVSLLGTFENKETNYIKKIIKPGYVCFDVGANFGWYTILLSKLVGGAGEIHAFEPIPDTYEVLRRNVKLNSADNVILNNCALDENVGTEELYIPDIGVSGSLKLHRYDKTYQTIVCETNTIDNYCNQNNLEQIDFLKADIEGAELMMLKGGQDTIRRYKPMLFLEVQKHSTSLFGYKPINIFDWLYDLGYKAFYLNNNSELVEVADYHRDLPDYNFFFINE